MSICSKQIQHSPTVSTVSTDDVDDATTGIDDVGVGDATTIDDDSG
jgi:hypothetical protein